MARRGRWRKKALMKSKAASTVAQAKSVPSATSNRVPSPKVHPSTNNCYPLNKLCRLCLLSNTNMEPIFSYPGDTRLSQKIYQCTNLEIIENDDEGIPTAICGQCKRQLDQCHEFRLLCWKNNEVLHNLHAILNPKGGSHAQNIRSINPFVGLPSSLSLASDSGKTATSPTSVIGTRLTGNLYTPRSATKPTPQPVVQLQKLQLQQTNNTLDLKAFCTPPKTTRGRKSDFGRHSFGEISLDQLYTPSRRGHKVSKQLSRFSRELVVHLTPISASLIKKYKKASVASTQTKAAVKSFPQSPKTRGRPKTPPKPVPKAKVASAHKGKIEKRVAKPVRKPASPPPKQKPVRPTKVVKPTKTVVKPVKISKPVKPVKAAKVTKPAKPVKAVKTMKAKKDVIAMPPKKRKENFEQQPATTSLSVTCSLCTQSFNNEKNLSRHMAAHENGRKQNRVYNCVICKREFLKANQLTDHLSSAEHVNNVNANEEANDVTISEDTIMPDEETGVSILPDDEEEPEVITDEPTNDVNLPQNTVADEEPLQEEQEPEPAAETITDDTTDVADTNLPPPSPDTNEAAPPPPPSPPPPHEAMEEGEPQAPEETPENPEPAAEEPAAEEINTNRDASPIPVDDDSLPATQDDGVQYSDVCSTNNAENLVNGGGADNCNASRRVTFSDITEIVE